MMLKLKFLICRINKKDKRVEMINQNQNSKYIK